MNLNSHFKWLSLITYFLFSITTFGQEDKREVSQSSYSSVVDRYKEPASTKEGIDRQLGELSDLKSSEIDEIEKWESVINLLNKYITERQSSSINIDTKWKEIDELVRNNPNGKNNNAIVEEIYGITASFDINLNSDPFEDQYSSVENFKRETANGIKGEISKTLKSLSAVNLVVNLYRSIQRNQDLSSDSRVQQIIQLKNEINSTTYQKLNTSIVAFVKTKIDEAQKLKIQSSNSLTKITEYYDSILKAKEEQNKSINQEAIKWGLPFFCITVIVLFYGAYFYRRLSIFKRKLNPSATDSDNVEDEQISKVLLEVITVLLLTMTVLILGLSGVLKENVLGTLLGAIAGYILNRTKDK